ALGDPESVPSARVLAAMAKDHANSYTAFVLAQSKKHDAALRALPFPPDEQARFERLARESHEKQKTIEAADTLPFESWRRQYLAREKLHVQPGRTP
ncbi:MAG: glutamate--cysteine ligase, partial [Pseudomonadota bacterium]